MITAVDAGSKRRLDRRVAGQLYHLEFYETGARWQHVKRSLCERRSRKDRHH